MSVARSVFDLEVLREEATPIMKEVYSSPGRVSYDSYTSQREMFKDDVRNQVIGSNVGRLNKIR